VRLVRFATAEGRLGVGMLDGEDVVEVVHATDRVPLGERVQATDRLLDRSQVRLLAPIARPPKFLAIGKNYVAHRPLRWACPPPMRRCFSTSRAPA
jgi:2-keto-4-pentenoate hydratase/2-oxohepta-3-ene-1,7-dioic acid hydratase in catechol pathway